MDVSQQYPSLEALRAQKQPPKSSTDMLRVRWKPFGVVDDSIQVAVDARSPPSRDDQAYRQSTSAFSHPDDLNDWENDWVDENLPHADYDGAAWVDGDDNDDGRGSAQFDHLWQRWAAYVDTHLGKGVPLVGTGSARMRRLQPQSPLPTEQSLARANHSAIHGLPWADRGSG
ncbi:hypothetical protein PG987_011718 [Apiospora arundinis]